MAYRRLSTLPLNEEIKSALAKASLKTVKDVMVLSQLTIMNMLQLSADQSKEFTDHLTNLCLPHKYNAFEMEQLEQSHTIPLGSRTLDILLHGGLLAGSITEFVGPPGIGKTQFCLHICASVVTAWRGNEGCPSAIYIDTESSVRPQRIVEMLSNRYPEQSAEVLRFLSHIHMFQPKTTNALLDIFESLEFIVVEKDARLVVVDSIAAIDDCLSSLSGRQRASQLSSLAARLKAVAHQLNICVVVTNQITTMLTSQLPDPDLPEPGLPEPDLLEPGLPEPDLPESDLLEPDLPESDQPEPDLPVRATYSEENVDSNAASKHIIPAMGYTWTHCITTRIVLEYTDTSGRQLVIAKSPVSPFAAFTYSIRKDGITIDESDGRYSYSGPDPGLFRIKAQEDIFTLTH